MALLMLSVVVLVLLIVVFIYVSVMFIEEIRYEAPAVRA